MNEQLLGTLVNLAISIVNRHLVKKNLPPLTDADTAQMKDDAIREGQALILGWFAAKGLPVPE